MKKADHPFDVLPVKSKGLGIQAKKDLVAGEPILTEQPLSHVLSRERRGLNCDFCLQDNTTLLKCCQCKFLYYCGVKCQRKDWALHKAECKCLQKVQPKRPPDICLLAARFLTKLCSNKTEPAVRARKLKQVKDYQKAVTDNEQVIDPKRKEMLFTFAFVLDQFTDKQTYEDLDLKPAHNFGLLSWLSCNCFTILNAEMTSIGIGIYNDASLINHSCKPNCIAVFDSTKISIRPVRPISQSEEIVISYIECLETTEERQRELLERYFFKCQCARCQESLANGSDSVITKCSNCSKEDAICTCGFLDSPNDYSKTIKKAQTTLRSALAECKASANVATFHHLQSSMESALKFMPCENNTLIGQCYEALFDACIQLQKWQLAIEYGLVVLEIYLSYYEELHPLTGIHLFKLGKIELFRDNLQDGIKYLQRAQKILHVTHGKRHKLTFELESMLTHAIREINERNNYKALKDSSV
eukprot:gene9249-10226_t